MTSFASVPTVWGQLLRGREFFLVVVDRILHTLTERIRVGDITTVERDMLKSFQ